MVTIEIVGPDLAGDASEIGQQDAEAHDQARGPFHVERAKAFEACESEPHTKQWNTEGTGAEVLQQLVAQPVAERSGQRERQEGQADEEADDEGGDRAQAPARIGAHTGTEARVTRRSWKCARTG